MILFGRKMRGEKILLSLPFFVVILASISLVVGFLWGRLVDFSVVPFISVLTLMIASWTKGRSLVFRSDLRGAGLAVASIISVCLLALSILTVAIEASNLVQYIISFAVASFPFALREDLVKW